MNVIQTIYEKPNQTNQADLNTPHILMYVNRIDKNVKTLEAKLIEENTSKSNLEKENIQEKKKITSFTA